MCVHGAQLEVIMRLSFKAQIEEVDCMWDNLDSRDATV